MNKSSSFPATAASAELGVPGYTFADLHDPERLASLYERFCEEVEAADPDFWAQWDAYRRAPDAPRTPVALSNLLVGMAPYVSRFLTRLFQVDSDLDAIRRNTAAQDDLFRFKIDFVRRRALPLLKGGAHRGFDARGRCSRGAADGESVADNGGRWRRRARDRPRRVRADGSREGRRRVRQSQI